MNLLRAMIGQLISFLRATIGQWTSFLRDVSITAAVITGILLLIGQILPIWSADTGDFYISVDHVPIEAKPIKHAFLSENIGDWPKIQISLTEETPQASVSVSDLKWFFKDYKYSVWLRPINDSNIIVRFENQAKDPPFTVNMFVFVNDSTKSITDVPITIQGIGGDGKTRNCTVYVVYKSPEDLVKDGAIQYQIGRYDESIKLFEKAAEIDPTYQPAWIAESYAYITLGDCQNALECANESIYLNQTDAHAWLIKSAALNGLGRYEETIECCDKIIKDHPEYACSAWNNKALALNNLEKYNESIECCNKAIKIDPEHASAWDNKALALNNLKMYNESIECCNKAIKLNPNFADAWRIKGVALYSLGKYGEATECYSEAIKLDLKN